MWIIKHQKEKLSPIQIALLLMLKEKPTNAVDIIKKLDEAFKQTWRPQRGSIYPALNKLQEKGFIERYNDLSTPYHKTYYRLTENGEKNLKDIMEIFYSTMDATGRYMEFISKYIQNFENFIDKITQHCLEEARLHDIFLFRYCCPIEEAQDPLVLEKYKNFLKSELDQVENELKKRKAPAIRRGESFKIEIE